MCSSAVIWFKENRKLNAKKSLYNKRVLDLVRNALIDKAKKHGWEINFKKPVKCVTNYGDSYVISFYVSDKTQRMLIIHNHEMKIADKMRANLGAENSPKNCKSIW